VNETAGDGSAQRALMAVAARALELVPQGARVGLGTGRAAATFIDALGERVRHGFAVTGVATSLASAQRARALGIPLMELEEGVALDLTVDGADEVAPNLDIVKGRGGALVHERIVAASSRRQVILVGEEKWVPALGARGPIPVEIIRLAQGLVVARCKALGLRAALRLDVDGPTPTRPFISENGNFTLDCHLPVALADGRAARALESALRAIPGVVDTGLFLGTAERVLVGYADGRVDVHVQKTSVQKEAAASVARRVTILPDRDAVATAAAEHFVTAAASAMKQHGRFLVALSGGSTPRAMYARLASAEFASRIDWSRVHVFWGDERCVPPDHPESNYRMARETLLDRVSLPSAQVHRMRGEDEPLVAAAAYERELRQTFLPGEEARFDLVLLGMGDNGHTASLFPGLSAVREDTRWVVAEHVAKVGMWRVTLTPVALNAAAQVLFMVTGKEKSAMLARVLDGPRMPETLPSQAIAPVDGVVTWLLDAAAAERTLSSSAP
jgi:6-phosphogluconolactonase